MSTAPPRHRAIEFSTARLTGGFSGALKHCDPREGSPARDALTRAKTLCWSSNDGSTATSVDRGLGQGYSVSGKGLQIKPQAFNPSELRPTALPQRNDRTPAR